MVVQTIWATRCTTGGHEPRLDDDTEHEVGENDAQPHRDLPEEAALKCTVVVPCSRGKGHLDRQKSTESREEQVQMHNQVNEERKKSNLELLRCDSSMRLNINSI